MKPARIVSGWKNVWLYIVLAAFLALMPLMEGHWLIRVGLSWILCLIVVGRIIQLLTEKAATRRDKRIPQSFLPIAIVGLAYLAMVLFMWFTFAFSSGMGYETTFSYRSETTPWLDTFIDQDDSPRLLLSVFYHISYLLGVLLGIPGSFVPFQFVYAALWWARGMLVFLIFRRLLPAYDLVSYLMGALVLVHASDNALQWIGQMHQPGFIFLMLLGIYFFIEALNRQDATSAYVLVVLAGICEALSLWTYESGLFIMILAPAVILPAFRRPTVRFAAVSGGWYAVPVLYSILAFQRFRHEGPTAYQASVMRTDWGLLSIASDLWFNVKASLLFWLWGPISELDLSKTSVAALAIGTTLAFAAGAAMLMVSIRRGTAPAMPQRILGVLIGVGLLVLVASFPAYLVLSGARQVWRTQILSGLGFGITWAALLSLIGNLVSKPRRSNFLASAVSLGLALILVFAGAFRAIELGSWHRARWERHQKIMAQIIELAPQVKAGTLFALLDIPRENDPFGDNMWFDMALRLAYPGITVSGFYYRDDGTPAPGYRFKLNENQWVREGRGYPPLLEKAQGGDALILESTADGIRILRQVPATLCGIDCATDQYHPENPIVGLVPSARAVNRYGPLP